MSTEVCKLAVMFLRSSLVGFVRLFWGWKCSENDRLSVYIDTRSPSLIIPTDSLETRRIVGILQAVLIVLSIAANPQIASSIVESVSVYMIAYAFIVRVKTEQLSVHMKHPLSSGFGVMNTSAGVKSLAAIIPSGVPLPLRNPLVVGSVHNGNLALGEWNGAVFLRGGHSRSSRTIRLVRCYQHLTPSLYQEAA